MQRAMKPHLQTPVLICFPPLLLLLLLLLSLSFLELDAMQVFAPTLARPGCKATCGNVSIPFPFGIGADCFLDSWYEIKCKEAFGESESSKKPILSRFGIEVMEIMIPDGGGTLSTLTLRIPYLKMCGFGTETFSRSIDLRRSPYNFSTDLNVFIMDGCPGNAILIDQSRTVMAGCSTLCHPKNSSAILTNNKYCYGIECCQMSLPSEISLDTPYLFSFTKLVLPVSGFKLSPLQLYHIRLNRQSSKKHHRCLAATLINKHSVDQHIGKLSSTSNPSTVPVLLHWSWMSSHLPDSNPHAKCWPDDGNITHCICMNGTAGNPYVLNGCQVPKDGKSCEGYYTWIKGNSSYYCHEAMDIFGVYEGLADLLRQLGSLLLLLGAGFPALWGPIFGRDIFAWLRQLIKTRKKSCRRVEFFKLKLQQHQPSNDGIEGRTKLFTHKQLKKATNNFNENLILGRGGQGTVYRGMLADGRIVAVKKSKLLDETQIDDFISEIVILSQIIHAKVVKLLGCCLETEVPLLVYEFVPNGTLYHYIHEPNQDVVFSWKQRLKIGADSARAIAHLHNDLHSPIYHKDIKSANILLDLNYTAKVSDFGCSKAIALDQTPLVTFTPGYLDPEYWLSRIYTEKSDVYSFGIVLLELLTSKKPIYSTETGEETGEETGKKTGELKSLKEEFFLHIQKSRLYKIVDPKVVREANQKELIAFVNLAERCLNACGILRPTMAQVAMELEMIIEPPPKMFTHDQETSSPIPVGASSPMYSDVDPQLHVTI